MGYHVNMGQSHLKNNAVSSYLLLCKPKDEAKR